MGILTLLQNLADLSLKIWIDDVFHIYLVKIIGPWMQNLEALILDLLVSVSLDIGSQEVKGSLICLDGVSQVILRDFFWLSKVRTNSFDT